MGGGGGVGFRNGIYSLRVEWGEEGKKPLLNNLAPPYFSSNTDQTISSLNIEYKLLKL